MSLASPWSIIPSGIKSRIRAFMVGTLFRLLTKPNPPAGISEPRRLAIAFLIPHLGDSVMLYPLLDAVRRENPDLEISCFTYGAGRLLAHHPAVDRHYNLSPELVHRFRKYGSFASILAVWWWWRGNFRSLRFHYCVLLRGGVDPYPSAHLAWLLGGRERVGFAAEVEPELKPLDLQQNGMLTRRVSALESVHEIDRGCRVLVTAGLLKQSVDVFQTVESLRELATLDVRERLCAEFPQLRKPFAIVAPGASLDFKRWSSERFAKVANMNFSSRGFLTVLVGGSAEIGLCTEVAEQSQGPSLNLAGKTEFAQLVTLCANARAFIGNDSGPAHVAGACGVPTVIVSTFSQAGSRMHHSSPARSHPAGPLVRVVQPVNVSAPCSDQCLSTAPHCILQVSIDEVSRALVELMREPALISTD